jgi:hypothetical protein
MEKSFESKIFSEDDKVSSRICETAEEAIKSETFLRLFTICINKLPNNINKEYYI